jgi:hypothetical protein
MDPGLPASTDAADGERRACFNCDFINAAAAAACEHCGANLRGVPLQRDLKMEAHLTAIAMWFRICGYCMALLALIVGVYFAVFISRLGPYRVWDVYRLTWGLFMLVPLGLASILVGVYLARFSNFARITAGILTALGTVVQGAVIINPYLRFIFFNMGSHPGAWLSMAILGAIMCALFNHRAAVICSEGYRCVAGSRRGDWPVIYRNPLVWVLSVGSALFVAGDLVIIVFSST